MQQMVLKKAWMTKESVISVRVLRNCFDKVASAISYVNNTFDKFWLMDTLQMTVTIISSLARIVTSPEKFSEHTFPQIVLAAFTITRMLLFATFCGDTYDEVYFKILEMLF